MVALPNQIRSTARCLAILRYLITTKECFYLGYKNPKETLINSADEMKREAHGTQQPRDINKIGERASTAQRSDSLV